MLVLALIAGCGGGTVELTPETAAELADTIARSPDPQQALDEAGTDASSFEAYLFTLAADAELTRRYLAARR